MDKKALFFNKILFLSFLFFASLFFGTSFSSTNIYRSEESGTTPAVTSKMSDQNVLGRYYNPPQIYITGGDRGYVSGGMIPLASTDEPAVEIGGYNTSGNAQVSVYKADLNSLLEYLTHDKDGKQLKKTPDVSKFQFVTTVTQDINIQNSNSQRIALPFEETGIWYLTIKLGEAESNAFVIRSNIGIIAEEGNNELIFWGQNYKTKRSITGGTVKVLNLRDGVYELQSSGFNSEGIASAPISADADIALIEQDGDNAIIPINLKYLNVGYSYSSFKPKEKTTNYFVFTDRPIYKPGDTVYFKAVLRDDDDARYTIPEGGVATVKIFDGYDYGEGSNQPVSQNNFPISGDGTINGQYKIPENAKVGSYSLQVSDPSSTSVGFYGSTSYFDVQFYQKPEFSIDVSATKTDLISGDPASFTITGTYFSGQPLMKQDVNYTVYSSDFYEFDYLQDQRAYSNDISETYRYGYWHGNNKVAEGTVTLDNNGQAEVDISSKTSFNKGKSQVFSVEASLDDGSITPAFARRNILVYAGEYGIYRRDTSYGSKVNEPLTIPVSLVPYRSGAKVNGLGLTAKIHRVNWVSYQEENKKYPSYRKEEEDLPPIGAKTDNEGNASFSFTPLKVGSYTITVEGEDSRGNYIAKEFYSYIHSEDYSYSPSSTDVELTLSLDKQKYLPSDTVRLDVFSTVPDRDVFLALERGRVQRYQVIRLNGKRGSVEIPLVSTDIPNVYAAVYSFSSHALDSTSVNIPVLAEGKKVIVTLTPSSQKYGPGETSTVNVSTTDYAGNPISADLALWAVDKSIFELADSNLGDIFDTYWSERYNSTEMAHSLEGITVNLSERGGCFVKGTSVLMGDGTYKEIENVKTGDYVLTRTKDGKNVNAKVTGTHSTTSDGYLIINGDLRVTPNHIMWVNGLWNEAGSIQVGDTLLSDKGHEVEVSSIEWQGGKYEVFNLEVEKYHTYFAGGVWVHNQKGGGARANFKDTAYWNPSVRTDQSGHAKVSFKLPDNLTTWVIASVANTGDTKVGQKTTEIVVTKDLIVRPILPNILRVDDTMVLSALVQNFTDKDQTFDIDLKFDSGEIEQDSFKGVSIPSGDMEQIYWKIKPSKENEKAKLTYSAKSVDDKKLTDIVIQQIPVKPFGFAEKTVSTGDDAKTYQIKFAEDAHEEKSSVVLSVSPTIIGTLPLAMRYLVDYPYGCVEQTTSRFVPAVIAKANSGLFAGALKDKDIDDIIKTGIKRLSTQQLADGGWPWWFSGQSDPFITSYVIEYLLEAESEGLAVDSSMLQRAKAFLEEETVYDPKKRDRVEPGREDRIAKNYGLVLLGDTSKVKKVTDYSNLSADLLAINVMTNYLLGDSNPASNGLNQLMSLAQTEGDGVYWNTGSKANFGSKDASTALAVRAIVLADGDRDMAVKAVRYLTRNRRSEFWSNTYATAQVVRALTDFSKTGNETTPSYSYDIKLDGKEIAQGSVTSSNQAAKEITIPNNSIKSEGSTLAITKSGEGQIYSTLELTDYHTDKNSKAVSHGMTIKREYVNAKGSEYTLGVGDTVQVRLTVSGLSSEENYGVISDELPAGMVPINESFKNEQYGQDINEYYYSYGVSDREITQNGIVLSFYRMQPGENTFTYRARVVSEGSYIVPPALVSLMYAPEINGRSDVDTIQIGRESQFVPGKGLKMLFANTPWIPVVAVGLVIGAVAALVILKKKGKIFGKGPLGNPSSKSQPPPPPIIPPTVQ